MPVPEAFLTVCILPNRVLVQDPGRNATGQIKISSRGEQARIWWLHCKSELFKDLAKNQVKISGCLDCLTQMQTTFKIDVML